MIVLYNITIFYRAQAAMNTNYDVRPAPPKTGLSKYPQIPRRMPNWDKTARTFRVYLPLQDGTYHRREKKTDQSWGPKENGDFQMLPHVAALKGEEERQICWRKPALLMRKGQTRLKALSSTIQKPESTPADVQSGSDLDAVLLGTVLMSLSGLAMPLVSDGINCRIRKTDLGHICPTILESRYPMTL